jgi:hypothetical protein
MTQNQSASETPHHLLCETDNIRHWSNEPSESSARAHADEQVADPHAGWAAIWIIPCTGDPACPVCVAHRKDINEVETFSALTARREPYWQRHL